MGLIGRWGSEGGRVNKEMGSEAGGVKRDYKLMGLYFTITYNPLS